MDACVCMCAYAKTIPTKMRNAWLHALCFLLFDFYIQAMGACKCVASSKDTDFQTTTN